MIGFINNAELRDVNSFLKYCYTYLVHKFKVMTNLNVMA